MLLCVALMIILDIDDSLVELPGRHLAVEENVQLAVRAMLHLRQEEVCHDPADDSGAAPDIAALATKIPARRIEQLGSEVDHRNLGDVVSGATDSRAQGSQTD